jgi:hypothetical protein
MEDPMPRFLIELPHEEGTVPCARVVQVFLQTGSHFLTHADWGCRDGVHKAWIIVDVANKNQARDIVPPPYRSDAKIVQLNSFSLSEIEAILKEHGA